MIRITASFVPTEMLNFKSSVNDGAFKPSIHEAVDTKPFPGLSACSLVGGIVKAPVSAIGQIADPVPTVCGSVKLYVGKKPSDSFRVELRDRQWISHGIIVQQAMGNVK
jgi:hypothetical protein